MTIDCGFFNKDKERCPIPAEVVLWWEPSSLGNRAFTCRFHCHAAVVGIGKAKSVAIFVRKLTDEERNA